MSIVEAHELEKRFGDFVAVRGVTFRVERGEIFGFLGPNGAGKSTTIRMLCGLLAPTSGSAKVAGVDVAADPEGVKWNIGYMSQKFSLYQDLSVDENLSLFGALYGLDRERFAMRRGWALDLIHLRGREESQVRDLPGGHRQRLALACALLHEPDIVFLDEPTAGVDPIMRRTFFERIDELSAAGTTVFLTTHFLDEAEYCHRCAFIAAGRLIAIGTPLELKARLARNAILELPIADPGRVLGVLSGIGEVEETSVFGAGIHVMGKAGVSEERLRRVVGEALLSRGIPPPESHRIEATLEDVFIRLATEAAEEGPPA